MKLRNKVLSALAGVALVSSLVSAPAAAEESSFAMLEGVQAQALPGSEMDSIRGTAITLRQLDLAFEIALARAMAARPEALTAARVASIRTLWNSIRLRLIALGVQP